jgi:hypothetical protein
MRFRGLQQPREMWAALHDQEHVDQALWDMALRQIHQHGCAACKRRRRVGPRDGSAGPVMQTPSHAFRCETA